MGVNRVMLGADHQLACPPGRHLRVPPPFARSRLLREMAGAISMTSVTFDQGTRVAEPMSLGNSLTFGLAAADRQLSGVRGRTKQVWLILLRSGHA